MEVRSPCPECRSAGSVEREECQVCFAELDENRGFVPEPARPSLRFADVIVAPAGSPPVAEAGTTTVPA